MIYHLPLEITREDDLWMARSSAIQGLLVTGDSLEQVLEELPVVVQALFETSQEKGWVFAKDAPDVHPAEIVWDLELPHLLLQAA